LIKHQKEFPSSGWIVDDPDIIKKCPDDFATIDVPGQVDQEASVRYVK
jgi:hypothetical protein